MVHSVWGLHSLLSAPFSEGAPGLRLPLTFPDSPERYRVRVFFRAWQVTSGGLFGSVFWPFWANVLRRLARWQGPRPDPQGITGLGVIWAEGGGDVCFLEPGERGLFPALVSLLGRGPPSP